MMVIRKNTLAAYSNNVRRRRWRGRLIATGTPVLTGSVGVAYAGFTMTATGGKSPYSFELIHGVFPDGIAIDTETGAVAGTPTETGAFLVTLGVRDAINALALLPSFTLMVT